MPPALSLSRFRFPLVPMFIIPMFIGALGVVASVPCQARPRAPAYLNGLKPLVEIRQGKKNWVPATQGTLVAYDQPVRTGAHGSVKIFFNNTSDTWVALRERTQAVFSRPKSESAPLFISIISALGEIAVNTRGKVKVRVGASVAAAQNASLDASDLASYSFKAISDTQILLTVAQGTVKFSNDSGSQVVGPGQQSIATPGSVPSPPTVVDASGALSWTNEISGLPLPFEFAPTKAGGHGSADETALDTAKELLQQGQAPAAAEAFRALLGTSVDDEARAGLALALLSNGRKDEALPVVAQASTPYASGVRALIALEESNSASALQILQPLAQEKNAPFQLVSLLALAQIQSGDITGARGTATRAQSLAPSSPSALATLALAQLFAGGADKAARTNARRAIELDPASPLALLAYGRVEAAHGNLDDARWALQQAARLAPDLPGVQRDFGAVATSLDRLASAEEAYRAALVNAPDDPRTLAGLGTVLLLREKPDEALPLLERARKLAPNDFFVRTQWVNFLVRQRSPQEALAESEFLLSSRSAPKVTVTSDLLQSNDPAFGRLFVLLSEAALYAQRLNDALRYATAAVRLLPNSSDAQYQVGRVFLEQGLITQAQNRFLLATILDPNSPRARYALGYTQDLIAQGNDLARPFGQTQAAREGAPNASLSLQSQLSPGSVQQFQAIAQDPTSVRIASRSFGDWSLGGSLGSDSSATGDLSYAKLSHNGQRLSSFILHRDTTAGARQGAGYDTSSASLILGQKAKNSSSSLFGYATVDRVTLNPEGEFDQPLPDNNANRKQPIYIVGGNLARGQNGRLRFIVQQDGTNYDATFASSGTLDAQTRGLHAEARYDDKISEHLSINAGASIGQRRYDTLSVIKAGTSDSPLTYFVNNDAVAHNTVGYTRLALTPSSTVKLEGELKVRSYDYHALSGYYSEPSNLPPTSHLYRLQGGELLPSFIATVRSGRSTLFRFRSRRLLGAIDDFELLSPVDLFSFDSRLDVPELDPTSRGVSYELEANHTFSNSAFLRVGLFRVQGGNTARSDVSETYTQSRVQGLRVGFEGILNPRTTFFLTGSLNGSRAVANNLFSGGTYTPSTISGLPDYTAEMGFQYLNKGFFVQPSFGYLGPRERGRFDGASARQQLGGVPLLNLRIGTRSGVRRSAYIEFSNILNRTYSLASNGYQRSQAGFQVRFGTTLRF